MCSPRSIKWKKQTSKAHPPPQYTAEWIMQISAEDAGYHNASVSYAPSKIHPNTLLLQEKRIKHYHPPLIKPHP